MSNHESEDNEFKEISTDVELVTVLEGEDENSKGD